MSTKLDNDLSLKRSYDMISSPVPTEIKNDYGEKTLHNKNNGNIIYVGMVKNDVLKHGLGTSFTDTGKLMYHGFWSDNEYNGEGVIYHPNGIINVSGTFANGKYNSKHMKVYDNQNRLLFSGQYMHGLKIRGHWRVYENKDEIPLYQGVSTFKNDVPEGTGSFIHSPRNHKEYRTYNGSIKNGRPNGFGKMIIEHLDKPELNMEYKGSFVNALFEGNGELIDKESKYVGEFSSGKKFGFGTLTDLKTGKIIYEGKFANNMYHGPGKLFKLSSQVSYTGDFNGGHLHEGRIDSIHNFVYKGELLEFAPFGKGTLTIKNTSIESYWDCYNVIVGNGIHTKIIFDDNRVVEGVASKFVSDDVEERLSFDNCTERLNGKIVFVGKAHITFNAMKIIHEDGMLYLQEKPRIKCIYDNNIVTLISEVYDIDGILMMTCGNNGYISGFDGDWPVDIYGSMNIMNSFGNLMYEATFLNGFKNCLQAPLKVPIVYYEREEEFQDMISFETIPFGTIGYMLNGNQHIVSKDTLLKMRETQTLMKHPLTRAPILRIERVIAVQKK